MIERVNLVDAQGVPRVFGLSAEEACTSDYEGLYVPIAVAVVYNHWGEVLVQQRASGKKTDPEKLDLVCGIVSAGEKPIKTAARESLEETGVLPLNVKLIAEGVNVYNRYRYLFMGRTFKRGMTVELPNHEVEWAGMKKINNLERLIDTGDIEPVGDFFEHLALTGIHQQALISREQPLLAYASPQEA